jgi:hypothetical protein
MMVFKSVDELADIVAAFDAVKAFVSEEQGGGCPREQHRGIAQAFDAPGPGFGAGRAANWSS